MAYITTSVEYGIHCLLWLVGDNQRALSSRELAELQGISPSFLAKIFPKLEKAGIVTGYHARVALRRLWSAVTAPPLRAHQELAALASGPGSPSSR